jgi:hypothetical protein
VCCFAKQAQSKELGERRSAGVSAAGANNAKADWMSQVIGTSILVPKPVCKEKTYPVTENLTTTEKSNFRSFDPRSLRHFTR